MILRHILLSLVICLSVSIPVAQAKPRIFNGYLFDAYLHPEDTFAAQRIVLSFDNEKTAANCLEYWENKKTSRVADTVNNVIQFQEYLVCDSVPLLMRTGESAVRDRTLHTYGAALLHRLDLRSFPSSLKQRIEDEQIVLNRLAPDATRAEGNYVILEDENWLFEIEIVAEADMDGDGEPDWLLWLTDSAKQGNYRSYQVLLVPSPFREGC